MQERIYSKWPMVNGSDKRSLLSNLRPSANRGVDGEGKKPESFRSKGKIIAFPVYTWKETSFYTLDAVGLMKCKCTGWIYSGWSVVGVKSGSSDVIAFRNG